MNDLEKLIAAALLVPMGDPMDDNCDWGLNIMLWGDPGIGKSQRVHQAATMAGLPCKTVLAATTQPEDVSGAAFSNTTKMIGMMEAILEGVVEAFEDPQVFMDTGLLGKLVSGLSGPTGAGTRILKKALAKAKEYGKSTISIEPLLPGFNDLMIDKMGVLFLDELSCARPAVQGAYLGVALNRRAGDKQLPGGVRIIAAGNPPESAAGGWELEPPMANRFCHFDCKVPSVEEWTKWLISESGAKMDPIEDGELKVRQNWEKHWPIVKGLVAGFMQSGAAANLLHNIPADGHKDRGRAWQSPRTWEFATRAIATCRCLGLGDDVRDAFVEGCVGRAAAVHLSAWLLTADVPDPETMIKDGWVPDRMRLDRSIAAYTGLSSYVNGKRTLPERIAIGAGAWRCVRQAMEAGMLDIVLTIAQSLIQNGVSSGISKEIDDELKPVLLRLSQAGMNVFVKS